MIISTNWLKEYVECSLDPEQLAERLTMVGLEVEALEATHSGLRKVITARVEAIESHPRADRLQLCRVSDGRSEYRIVCGAPNLKPGCVVPLALPGAELPGGFKLKETKIRGELSQGMLCSQKELQLGDDAAGIWLLQDDLPLGVPLAEALDLEDTLLEIGITPNRGDCLSVIGVAREAAAICGTALRYPRITFTETGPDITRLAAVDVEAADGCPRYSARLIQGVKIGPSPRWLRRRLEAIGLRSINNIVDVTNFVMMELGQPLHAFDFDRLRGGRIVVKWASEGDRFVTLDGVERELHEDTLMICDGAGPVAVAGIMGGLDSEITEATTRVLIESAYFEPTCIRRSSKKLGLRSESSYRFERGIDYGGVVRAVNRAAQLMLEVGGGELATGVIDEYPRPMEPPRLVLRAARCNRYLGLDLSADEMAAKLRLIEMKVEKLDNDRLQVVPPTFRPDIYREVDLIEEIARLTGYDQIPVTFPKAQIYSDPMDPHWKIRQQIKERLLAAGFFEALTYSFISRDALNKLRMEAGGPAPPPVALLNPLSEEQAVMRTSLVPGILQTVGYNFDHGNLDVRLFELSKVFLPRAGEPLPDEPFSLVGAISGRRDPRPLYGSEEEVGYEDIKGAVELVLEAFHLPAVNYDVENLPSYFEPLAAARMVCGDSTLGWLGRVHAEVEENFDLKSPVYLFELDFDRLFALRAERPMYHRLPKFPSVKRDMALIVDEDLPVLDPLNFIKEQDEALVERVEIFDIYTGKQVEKGRKSVGYRVIYRAPDRNLRDEEVNRVHEALIEKVVKRFGATLR